MRKKQFFLISLLTSAFICIFFVQAAPPDPGDEEIIASYERTPPIITHLWVQKLQPVLVDPESEIIPPNMIMKIQYAEEQGYMPQQLNVNYGAD